MRDKCFAFLLHIVLLHELNAAPCRQLERREDQYPPINESLDREVRALEDGGGRAIQMGISGAGRAIDNITDFVKNTGGNIRTGVEGTVDTAIYLGSLGMFEALNCFAKLEHKLELSTAEGIRNSVALCNNLAEMRKEALDNVAYYTKVGVDQANNALDHFQEYKNEKLLNLATTLSDPRERFHTNIFSEILTSA